MLDKINGLFANKRDRKSEVPPVPSIDASLVLAQENKDAANTASTTMTRAVELPPVKELCEALAEQARVSSDAHLATFAQVCIHVMID